jgi:hypothetical protein
MPFSPLKVNRRFGGTCRLHLEGRISQGRNQHRAGIKQLLGLFLDPEDGGDVSPTRLLTFNELHVVISRKAEIFVIVKWTVGVGDLWK